MHDPLASSHRFVRPRWGGIALIPWLGVLACSNGASQDSAGPLGFDGGGAIDGQAPEAGGSGGGVDGSAGWPGFDAAVGTGGSGGEEDGGPSDDGTAAEGGSAGTGGTTSEGGSGGSSAQPPDLDLGQVTWLHTNVSGWPVTVTLSSVDVDGGQICLNHNIADMSWPIEQITGTDVVANPWVFVWFDDRWYGATWEWLRPPGQTCKNTSSVAGDHIKVAPFDEASGWEPQSGETLYFMVSGLARGGLSNVQERSEPVRVVWP